MSQRIILLPPRRRFLANRFGLGYQLPLELVFLGGPLVDAGHVVRLIDNNLYGWGTPRLVVEVTRFRPDIVLLGHTGSTAAHPACIATARALRDALPLLRIGYGGVYPTYSAEAVLRDCPAIDVVVRREGEATARDLVWAWEQGRSLAGVEGITWRDGEAFRTNQPRPPICNLDACRPGMELVDWPGYTLFGLGRSAGMQFSRGCPLTCTYCGQWGFWRRYRHGSPANFVAQLRTLAERCDPPPRERGGFLRHACLSPTTLHLTGPIQASRLRGRVSSASRRVVLPALFPAGLDTGQALQVPALVRSCCERRGMQQVFSSFYIGSRAIPPSLERDGPLARSLWHRGSSSAS